MEPEVPVWVTPSALVAQERNKTEKQMKIRRDV